MLKFDRRHNRACSIRRQADCCPTSDWSGSAAETRLVENETANCRGDEPPEAEGKCRCPGCGGCGRCCGKAAPEYVVISSFVWPPWPEKDGEKS